MTCPTGSWTCQDGSLTAFLANQFQYFTTFTIKKILLFTVNFWCVYGLPFSCTSKTNWAAPSPWPPAGSCRQRSALCLHLCSPGWTNPLLWASPPASPQLQSPDQTYCRMSSSFFLWAPQNPTQVLQMQPGKCWIEGNNDFLRSTCYTPANKAWDMAGLLHCKSSWLKHPRSLLLNCFLAHQPSARYQVGIMWSYPMPDTGLQLYFLGTSGGSCQPISPGWPGPTKQQPCPPEYQHLLWAD